MAGYQAIKDNTDPHFAKVNQLIERITADLSKYPASPDIQEIVKELDDMLEEQYQALKMDMGENLWSVMADLYLTNPAYKKQ